VPERRSACVRSVFASLYHTIPKDRQVYRGLIQFRLHMLSECVLGLCIHPCSLCSFFIQSDQLHSLTKYTTWRTEIRLQKCNPYRNTQFPRAFFFCKFWIINT
jgi:putative component of membrane protein insertase Oxa1/YidC/SpoIIIJ protein YidD